MIRKVLAATAALALPCLGAPQAARSQDDHMADGHSHMDAVVDCSTLASPPWAGLSEADRQRFEAVRQAMAGLETPEAALAAGFEPALGDIPGMGVHYVNSERMRDGINVDAPDHLMFTTIDGREQLVGAAYAFIDVPETDEPIPFDSDLARWHDHPQFAPEGQTLHMLHVWLVPSSSGPFAGLNFWLPYQGAGVTPPSSCWMADPEDADRIRTVSFALVPPLRATPETIRRHQERLEARSDLLEALDQAAAANDHDAWVEAADRFLGDLTPAEQRVVEQLLQTLNMAQMSSKERGGG